MTDDLVLVTGGAGFIGSHVAAALAMAGRRVVVCDRLRSAPKALNLVGTRVDAVVHPDGLGEWLGAYGGRLDAIVHMGAVSSTAAGDADLVIQTNLTLSQSLWTYAAERGIRFVYASSAATYGDGSAGFCARMDRLDDLRPRGLYAWSKHLFDLWVRDHVHGRVGAHPRQWAGLKFFNIYGPGEWHKDQPSPFCGWVRDGRIRLLHHPVPGTTMARDFVHVDDAVAVVLWLLANPGVSGLFNVGTGKAVTWEEAVRIAVDHWPGPEKPVVEDGQIPSAWLHRYQAFTQADLTSLWAAGYTGTFRTVEDGVPGYLAWMAEQALEVA
jgi:ADP-L-glycero-D-manno-heptose 6-epimerase